MASKAIGQAHRLFQIDFGADLIKTYGTAQCLLGNIDAKRAVAFLHNRQTHAAASNAVADTYLFQRKLRAGDGRAHALLLRGDVFDVADGGDDAGKHAVNFLWTAGQSREYRCLSGECL